MKKIDAFLVWGQLALACLIVLCEMCAYKMNPDGNSDNALINYLLKNITIQAVVEEDYWIKEYPFKNTISERYLSMCENIKKAMENYCTASFPENEMISILVSTYKEKVINYNVASIPSGYDNKEYVSEAVNNILEFKENVNSLAIPFFYVQTPLQASIDYYNEKELIGDDVTIAERSYWLTLLLEENNVDVVNIAKDFPEGITFDKSSHWKPIDGLNCAKLISEKISNEYGLEMQVDTMDTERFYDFLSDFPDSKSTIEKSCGYEYSLPCPTYPTHFKRLFAEKSLCEGAFDEVFINDSDVWKLRGGAYHGIFSLSNALMYVINNEYALNDTKILLIGDSFDWPVASYMSLGCREVTFLHNASFSGSLVTYITQHKPDIVIVVYNDAEFYDTFTNAAYDLK